jgi:hypothetical protein
VREALENADLPGGRLVDVEIMRTEGRVVHGLVWLKGVDTHSLLDFEAVMGPRGEVVSVEVSGTKLAPRGPSKGAQRR